jgi:YHS domain-containing protein
MGRRYIYFCDNCKKDFGNSIHLNIKSAVLALSYPSKTDVDPTKSEWKQRQINLPCGEYHFCNDNCLGEFVQKQYCDLLEKLMKLDQANKTV